MKKHNKDNNAPLISMNANVSLHASNSLKMGEETANDYESPNLDGNLDDLISVISEFSQNISLAI